MNLNFYHEFNAPTYLLDIRYSNQEDDAIHYRDQYILLNDIKQLLYNRQFSTVNSFLRHHFRIEFEDTAQVRERKAYRIVMYREQEEQYKKEYEEARRNLNRCLYRIALHQLKVGIILLKNELMEYELNKYNHLIDTIDERLNTDNVCPVFINTQIADELKKLKARLKQDNIFQEILQQHTSTLQNFIYAFQIEDNALTKKYPRRSREETVISFDYCIRGRSPSGCIIELWKSPQYYSQVTNRYAPGEFRINNGSRNVFFSILKSEWPEELYCDKTNSDEIINRLKICLCHPIAVVRQFAQILLGDQ